MTRVFAFVDANSVPQVGVEWRGISYNFTLAWDLYRQIKLDNTAPQFPFVELLLESGLFYSETFDELFETLMEFRSIKDLRIRGHWKLRAPVQRPQKVIGIGRNYGRHALELGNAIPEEPVFFAKSPSSIIASGDRIVLPKEVGRVDYEGELALVIGKEAQNIPAEQAGEYIAGYTILNDVTARDIQKQDKEKKLPWFRAKSYNTFCPMGPWLVPAGEIADPQDLQVTVRVNEEVKQNGHTGDMLFPIPELVAYLSRHMTLMPGDVIATGTPEGVGPLQSGDVVEVEVGDIGVLRNTVK